jgi:cell division protein ZapA (FtsZ GTPase activity inhibitor)
MTPEEMKTALKEELDLFKSNLPKFVKPEELKEQFEQLETKMEALNVTDDLKELKESVEKQGLELVKMAEKSPKIVKTIPELLEEHKDKLTKLASREGGGFRFIIPKTEVTTSSVTTPYQGMQIPGAGMMPHQASVLRPLFQQVTLSPGSNGTVYYTDQTTDTNSAAADVVQQSKRLQTVSL